MAEQHESNVGKPSAAATPGAKPSITGRKPSVVKPDFKTRMAAAAKASGLDPSKVDVDPAFTAPEEKADDVSDDGADDADGTEDTSKDTKDDKAAGDEKGKGKTEYRPLKFSGTPEEKTAIAEALKNADLKTLALTFGVDPKLVDTANEKYAVVRRKQQKVDKGIEHINSESRRLTNVAANLRAEFGTPQEAKKLYRTGKYSAAATELQKWFGDDFATITKNIAKEVAGLSPEEKKHLEDKYKLEQENAELKAKNKTTETVQTEAQKRAKAVTTVSEKVAGHDVLKLKKGAELVLDAYLESWNEAKQSFRLTFKQAADQVLEEKMEEGKTLGLSKAEQKKADEKKEEEQSEKLSSGREEKSGRFTKKRSFEERMEAARRLTAKSLRQ